MRRDLDGWLEASGAEADLQTLLKATAGACAKIAGLVRAGELAGVLGSAGTGNVQGEVQKTLDVLANDVMLEMAQGCGVLAGAASEEEDEPVWFAGREGARYLMLFDPLDGSSNIDVNVSIGTIVSVLETPEGATSGVAPFLQMGRTQKAAAYAVYGPQTQLIVTVGKGVTGFTLDPESGKWLETQPAMKIPEATKEFSINMSNMRHWEGPVMLYIRDCLAGKEGPRGKDYNMRWVAAMVADVHRILSRGGVFMYPKDARDPNKPGKLRLMYEGNPMSLLVEQAGGAAFNGMTDILDVEPTELHQRVAVMMGSKEEVEVLRKAHTERAEASSSG